MKSIATAIALTAALAGAPALANDTVVCHAASFNAAGAITSGSMNKVNVVVFKDGKAAAFTAKTPFSIVNSGYNLSQPFDMSLVNAYGAPIAFSASGSNVTAKGDIVNEGGKRVEVEINVDSAKLTGTAEANEFQDGRWAGTEGPEPLVCSRAGIR